MMAGTEFTTSKHQGEKPDPPKLKDFSPLRISAQLIEAKKAKEGRVILQNKIPVEKACVLSAMTHARIHLHPPAPAAVCSVLLFSWNS